MSRLVSANVGSALSHHAVLVIVGILGALALVARSAAAGRRSPQLDPQRAFTAAQRQAIFERCGYRCEMKRPLLPRCSAEASHADHIYPWSKGGATSLANGAGLCARHNLTKSNRTPSSVYLRALERRRRAYFPTGVPVEVVWQVDGRW